MRSHGWCRAKGQRSEGRGQQRPLTSGLRAKPALVCSMTVRTPSHQFPTPDDAERTPRQPLLLLRFVFTLAALLRSDARAFELALFQLPPRSPAPSCVRVPTPWRRRARGIPSCRGAATRPYHDTIPLYSPVHPRTGRTTDRVGCPRFGGRTVIRPRRKRGFDHDSVFFIQPPSILPISVRLPTPKHHALRLMQRLSHASRRR